MKNKMNLREAKKGSLLQLKLSIKDGPEYAFRRLYNTKTRQRSGGF